MSVDHPPNTRSNENLLGSSWAEVVKDDKTNQDNETTTVDHRPGAWEDTKEHATFADVTKHNDKQAEEFPTPSEGVTKSDMPTSAGVGDLLNSTLDASIDTTVPPNPSRSFAAVTSNEGFPALSESRSLDQSMASSTLSSIPDVKDMLTPPSVSVPPPPPSQSFAKVAAKKPPARESMSERSRALLENQPEPSPLELNHENFPTLSQSTLMHETPADDRGMVAEITRLHGVAEAQEEHAEKHHEMDQSRTFADITGSNLENAPPSAIPRPVHTHPVYDEDTILRESTRREARKQKEKAVSEGQVTMMSPVDCTKLVKKKPCEV
ncbi:hypothetical protein DFQ30_006577 [Apophysomyces sp. BC1015]|nr:hypothetical protein DFQ30_006577 [Apophysomyces sp. BC1015]